MRTLGLFTLAVLLVAILGSSEANADPPGFGVSLNNVKVEKALVKADGTYTCPSDHEVIGGWVIFTVEQGQKGTNTKFPALVVKDNKGNATLNWDGIGAVSDGTYSAKCVLTFRKKNPGVGDAAFDVPSNEKTGVVIKN
ncbi:MAG: hypothetical protein K2X82_10090 [Gemmataceae bacterium]|nr:hypothetical protein [Gemmataceae bacterium]